MAADLIKTALAPVASLATTPVVVNSFGRSGSTVLYEAVVASAARRPPGRAIRGDAWRLDRDPLRRGRCYKSHDYPSERMNPKSRVVYVFGDPIAATHSLVAHVERAGAEWLREHCEHMRVDPFPVEELLHRDVLGITDHLRAWLDQDRVRVGFVRYEQLWDRVGDVSEFLGFPVELPAKRARTSTSGGAAPDIHGAYADAVRLVDSLPDWHVRG